MPDTASRLARRERAIARRAVMRKFGPGDATARAHSAATEKRRVI